MTIAAVPMGAAVLDVPRRGDVLVIKERVAILQRRAVPWQRPGVATSRLGRPQVHNTRSRKSSSTEWLTGAPLPRRKAVMGFSRAWLGLGRLSPCDYQIVEADKLRERADARRLLAQTLYANAAPSTTATATCWRRRSNVATSP